MSSIRRKNVQNLKRMGYELDEDIMLQEIRVTMRLNSGVGFMVITSHYDLQNDDTVTEIVSQFNRMIMGKLALE